MSADRYAARIATALLVVMVLTLVVGQLLGYPLLFSYVTSGSMEPTLSEGDGFVAVPAALSGEPQVGDVVVFQAEEVDDGGLTTHRIVGETDQGYVTRGDANPFTDQDAGERHLSEADVLASALQIDGTVIRIPMLGTAAMTLQAVISAPFDFLGIDRAGTVLVGVGLLLFALAGAMGEGRQTSRSTSRENVIAVWMLILLVAGALTVTATVAMVAPGGTYAIEVIVTDDPSDDSQVVAPGETATANYTVHHGGVVPTLVINDPVDEAGRTTVNPATFSLGYGGQQEVQVDIPAPDETGEYVYEVWESRYLLLLPPSVLNWLHSMHPLLAILAVNAVIASVVIAACLSLFGTGYLRLRPGSGVPLRVRLERRLRRFRRNR